MIIEKRKIPGISYAFTRDGIELPVLDITHPLFTSSIDEEKLKRMIPEIAPEAKKRAEGFRKMPLFIKRFLAKRSYIMAGMMEMTTGKEYLSGLSTMMMKLGPGLIGKGSNKLLDRLGSRAIGAVMTRMRTRDTSVFLANSIKSSLKAFPGKDLCLINIGGGTATDSFNALILVSTSEPELLSGIKTELYILDVDDYGPYFACQCAEALTSAKGILSGLDLTCRHIAYDWKNAEPLRETITGREDRIILFSSEGGLFEYGSETDIRENLNIINDVLPTGTEFIASVVKDPETVDPVMNETLYMTTIKPMLYGLYGLEKITRGTSWKILEYNENNPRYIICSISNKIN
jgi:hypothetical protein